LWGDKKAFLLFEASSDKVESFRDPPAKRPPPTGPPPDSHTSQKMGRMSSNPARALAALLLIAAAVLVASAADLAPGPLAAGPGPARTKLEDASSSPPPPAETPALEAAGARFVTATTPDGETISGFVGQPLSLIADDAAIAAAAAAADAADASAAGAAARVNEGAPGQPGPAAAAAEVAAMASMFSGILSQHNSYRSRHGSPALVWNDAVASRAQNTVVSCRFAHNAQVRKGRFAFNFFSARRVGGRMGEAGSGTHDCLFCLRAKPGRRGVDESSENEIGACRPV